MNDPPFMVTVAYGYRGLGAATRAYPVQDCETRVMVHQQGNAIVLRDRGSV